MEDRESSTCRLIQYVTILENLLKQYPPMQPDGQAESIRLMYQLVAMLLQDIKTPSLWHHVLKYDIRHPSYNFDLPQYQWLTEKFVSLLKQVHNRLVTTPVMDSETTHLSILNIQSMADQMVNDIIHPYQYHQYSCTMTSTTKPSVETHSESNLVASLAPIILPIDIPSDSDNSHPELPSTPDDSDTDELSLGSSEILMQWNYYHK